jgi:hypothetical protein
MLAAEQVVQAVAALLATVSGMGSSVYTDHPWPLAEAELPAWRVFDEYEAIDPHGLNFPARNHHELTVKCQGIRRDVETIRADLNAMAAAALTVLFASKASTALSPLNCAMTCTAIERQLTTEGEAAVGRVDLSLRVRFTTYSNAPEVIT